MLYVIGSEYVVKDGYHYDFENPSSEESAKLPLDHFSQTYVHWHFLTNYRPSEKTEEIMIAKLIDFMRWTRETVHEETGRSPRVSINLKLRSNKKNKRRTKIYGPDQSGCPLHFSNVFYDRKTIQDDSVMDLSNDFHHANVAHHESDGNVSPSPVVNVEKQLESGVSAISSPYRSYGGSLMATAIRLPGQNKIPTNTLNIFVSPPPVNA